MKLILLALILTLSSSHANENNLNIAVSSNFLNTFTKIKYNFENKYKCKIITSADSTANLFTKIKYGAPFDIFISADAKHPLLLETKKNKSIIYAFGKIVLFNNKSIKKNILIHFNKFKKISLSNPKLSPYGFASKTVYKNLKIKNKEFILAANINQTFNFIYTNNSDIGIIALSQKIHNHLFNKKIWNIPKYLYPKIEQRLINLNNKITCKKFIKYIQNTKIQQKIKNFGYKINE